MEIIFPLDQKSINNMIDNRVKMDNLCVMDKKSLHDTQHSTGRIGGLCELKACVWLLNNGYEVFRNVVPTGHVDVVAIKDSITILVDVKKANFYKEKHIFWRADQDKAQEYGVEILYVMPDGICKWANESDPFYGKKKDNLCVVCKKEYIPRKYSQRFCSSSCRQLNFHKLHPNYTTTR